MSSEPQPEGSQPKRYLAANAYLDSSVPASYEEVRFSGPLGRYRYRREQRSVAEIVEMLPTGVSVLDCPCGTGRWWPILSTRASEIRAVDLSPAMLDTAAKRIESMSLPITLELGDAEALDLEDASIDVVFSHALTKHLPIVVQQRVLSEFARVSSGWVICSFSLLHRVSYEVWKRRRFADSHPLLPEQLSELAAGADLAQVAQRRCTTPVGVEHTVLFKKVV